MQPIPRGILKQSIIYYERAGFDEYGNETWVPTGTDDDDNPLYGLSVQYVRVEPVKESALRALGEMKDDKLVVYIDAKNSLPFVNPRPMDKVTYGGVDYLVRHCNEMYGTDGIHHVSVFLK